MRGKRDGPLENPFGRLDRTKYRIPLISKRRMRVSTFNVNDKLPPPGTTELASLVGTGKEDLLVFGFQEVGGSLIRAVRKCTDDIRSAETGDACVARYHASR